MDDTPIQAIIGLGNPTARYQATRHNVGFWFVDELARDVGATFRTERKLQGDMANASVAGQSLRLLKPTTYMNNSGRAVQALMAYFKCTPQALLVVHDDLDLPPGAARLKRGGGHGGHNGLRDIIRHVGAEFCRLRLGIGHPGHRDQVLNHVLRPFNGHDEQAVIEAINRSRDAISILLRSGWQRAVQELHTDG